MEGSLVVHLVYQFAVINGLQHHRLNQMSYCSCTGATHLLSNAHDTRENAEVLRLILASKFDGSSFPTGTHHARTEVRSGSQDSMGSSKSLPNLWKSVRTLRDIIR